MENQKLSSRSPKEQLLTVFRDSGHVQRMVGYFDIKRDSDWLDITKKVYVSDGDTGTFVEVAKLAFYKPDSYSIRAYVQEEDSKLPAVQ